ncbi:MobF family relaxase [Sphingomonas sp. H39-1-10]|uniref:MobF family relaxase n=2 Tax=Sphingomonas TaxID=13687 RepID=UPI00088EF55C|nr:MobF family relaxase [Sphingomonas sp. NFR15]MDF0489936.1 MobF family relaxase [Sphingomonas pollutisoli]SDA36945.1 conjugative relaxase domain-containing protein, TrwC/TraI family [Sphingomonas sp. NFR15]
MAWAEKTIAEGRCYARIKNGKAVRTGNLVYALFQHDTSRKLDPNGHIHAVVAPVTQRADGTWVALGNNQLFTKNTTLGLIHAAAFRGRIQALGYETVSTGKHGRFEIAGVSREVIEHYSQRRVEIIEKANELRISTPQGMDRLAFRLNAAEPVADCENPGSIGG